MPSDAKKREKKKKKEADKQRQQKRQIPGNSRLDEEKTDDTSNVTVDKTEETKGGRDSGDKAPQLYETASGAEGHELLYQRVPQINESRTGATIIEGKQDNPTAPKKTTMAQANKSITEEMNQTENKNWVKAGLCFHEAKEVLLDFVAGDWTDTKPAADCDISPILKFVIGSRKYQQQQFGGLQDSADKVRCDRNHYIHDRPQPKVTYKELNRFKSNISNLLKNQMLQSRGKTERAQRRINEICKEEYIILPKDEYSARLSNIEGKLDMIETTENKKIPFSEKEIKDIRDLLKQFECSRDNSELETKFQMVEADLKDMISKLTVQVDKVKSDLKETKSKLTDQVHKLESQFGEMMVKDKILQETLSKRRSETDGLRQLKNQTEDDLDTFRKMGFIPTSQTEEARKLLQEKRSIVIKGNPGEGKTSTALHLIDNDNYTDQRVVISSPEQWDKVDTKWVKIIVVEDIFGQYDLDPSRLQKWIDTYLKKIQNHVDEGKLQAIITIRDDVFLKASSKLKSFKLFHSDRSLTLCSDELQNEDKKNILERELKRNNKDMTVDKIEQCIANFKGLIGFPQCCTLFAGSEDLFGQGPDFFRSPEKFLLDNIRNLKADSFLSLAFLFCSNEIEEEYLSPSPIKESKKYLPILQDIAQYLNIPFNESTVISLRHSYEYYSGLYVKKVSSCQNLYGENMPYLQHSRDNVSKSCILFQHGTIYEAVGQVLGDSCPEMVIKYGDSGYIYRRTYTANFKNDDIKSVFIPVSVYGLLAERMVHDVVEKKIVESVVKHSAFKQNEFVMKIKDELHKVKKIMEFLMANRFSEINVCWDIVQAECVTFLQCVLQSDEDTVKLVYNHFIEFLACIHDNKSSDCWQCKEKETLLELALYYHHFEIAEQLITMNTCYTHAGLCNAARHGDLSRVKAILEEIKRRQVFSPECNEAKRTLCRAFISGNQDVIELLLQEGITLHDSHVVDVVEDGDIYVLIKVVEHLKLNKNWNPHLEQDMAWMYFLHPDLLRGLLMEYNKEMPYSVALYMAFCKKKFDMADYLLENEAKGTLGMLVSLTAHSSKQAVARMIQNLKDTGTFDPHCNGASKALETAYENNKFDVCDLLIQEGVSLEMKNLSGVINRYKESLHSVEKVIQHLKDTHSWDPECNDASKALKIAYLTGKYDVCDLLIEEGVLLTMKGLGRCTYGSLESVKKAIQHLKDTVSWNPKCDEASNAFIKAYKAKKYDVCALLIEEGVSCAIQYLPVVISQSLDLIKTRVKQLKDTDSWDAKCLDASEALEMAYSSNKYDVCHWLIQEGVSLTMRNLANVTSTYQVSLESVKKIIQHLKDVNCWDPKSTYASIALINAYWYADNRYDVCVLLIQEGVALTMNFFLNFTNMRSDIPIELVKKIIQHLKDINCWDPSCDDASEALEVAFRENNFDVFELLFQEQVSLKMKHLPYMIQRSQDLVKTAVKRLKDTNSWDANCDDASEALAKAHGENWYDACQLLIQEGVSLTMKNLPSVIVTYNDYLNYFRTVRVSLESVENAIQHLKDTNSWDHKCDDASEALGKAYREGLYDVCQLLLKEGVSLTTKNLPVVIGTYKGYFPFHQSFSGSFKSVQKAIQHIKNTGNWDPKCNDASKALEEAYLQCKYDACYLLMQEGVSLTMKCLCYMPFISIGYVKSAVKQVKDTDSWDAECDDASEALARAFFKEKTDVSEMLIQEGITLKMKNLKRIIKLGKSLESVQKAVQHLKDNDNWDAKCDHASTALAKAYRKKKNDVCDLLIKEGVSLKMINLTSIRSKYGVSLKSAQKAVQHLKNNGIWDPKCDHASKALAKAFGREQYDWCRLLIKEGVSLTISNDTAICSAYRLEKTKAIYFKDKNCGIRSVIVDTKH